MGGEAEPGGVLLRLLAQGQAQGADLVTLRALVEEASQAGAERALSRIGLSDRQAGSDIGELRQLLQAWRDARKTARMAVIGWVVRGFFALILIGLAVKVRP